MEKLLIITYYWPPGGGPGVQRWLKLSKFLAQKELEVHVVTVDPQYASYLQQDQSLCQDVHKAITVHHTRSFEPINYYAKLFGKDKVPISGFSNVDNTNWKQKLANFIRSNFFIPDPRRGWTRYAYKKALEVIKQHKIKYVITTSPPHSVQLVGLRLKKRLKTSIKWIVDFRDPWTDIYYYKLLQHSFLSHMINKRYEKKVIEKSDAIFTVGEGFKSSFLSKSKEIPEEKIKIVTNGFDPDDFKLKVKSKNSNFVISYVGTISNHYRPEVFFRALAKLIAVFPNVTIQFKLVGVVSNDLKKLIIENIGDSALFVPTVSHDEAIKYMLNSNVLLLITQGEEGTIPGKAFEYLASKNKILCIGKGDAARIIASCEAGKSFERDEEEAIFLYLEESLIDFLNKKPLNINTKKLLRYSREHQANQVLEYCK